MLVCVTGLGGVENRCDSLRCLLAIALGAASALIFTKGVELLRHSARFPPRKSIRISRIVTSQDFGYSHAVVRTAASAMKFLVSVVRIALLYCPLLPYAVPSYTCIGALGRDSHYLSLIRAMVS